MSNAWTVLKQNVATTNVQYGSHMPEIKPHPAAVSYAQRSGYQPNEPSMEFTESPRTYDFLPKRRGRE